MATTRQLGETVYPSQLLQLCVGAENAAEVLPDLPATPLVIESLKATSGHLLRTNAAITARLSELLAAADPSAHA